MPYAISDQRHGWRSVASGEGLEEGEFLVEEAPNPETWLEQAKAEKIQEFARRAIDDLAPLFTPNAGRDETVLLLVAHILEICDILGIPADARLTQVLEVGQKALAKRAEIEEATAQGLKDITW